MIWDKAKVEAIQRPISQRRNALDHRHLRTEVCRWEDTAKREPFVQKAAYLSGMQSLLHGRNNWYQDREPSRLIPQGTLDRRSDGKHYLAEPSGLARE